MVEYNSGSQAKTVNEDERLIAAAKEDAEAFGRLYDKYYNDIFRYIHCRVSDHALAEDLTSNTFLNAFRHIGRYKWRRIPFNAWLHRIAMNEIRKYHRKQRRASAVSLQASSSTSRNPTSREEYIVLYQAILKLKPVHRTVITLRYFEDRTVPEICEITGEKEGTVKSRLHRGLEELRGILIRQGVL
jgi:RNA polymerase sigma-70 factor (ECF subfamily)